LETVQTAEEQLAQVHTAVDDKRAELAAFDKANPEARNRATTNESAVLTADDVDSVWTHGWNAAVEALTADLQQRIDRGPAGERAGLHGVLDVVRTFQK
jgi:hypothetical protein